MNEQQFVLERFPSWEKLKMLSRKANLSPKALTDLELKEFVTLYKQAARDLSMARGKSVNPELINYLNSICTQAYDAFYRPPSKPFYVVIHEALSNVAWTFRRKIAFMIASLAIALLSGLYGYMLPMIDKPLYESSLPAGSMLFEEWKKMDMDERTLSESMMMTVFYASNNPMASAVTSSLGLATFGVLSAQSLFTNFMMLGALTYEMSTVGGVGYLYISIMPHGVTELSGILISGAAGLMMGWTLLFPGRRKRGEALLHTGKDALTLLVAGILLMYIAAPIEGFFSFSPSVPRELKAGFAILSAAAWGVFWWGYGRKYQRQNEELQLAEYSDPGRF